VDGNIIKATTCPKGGNCFPEKSLLQLDGGDRRNGGDRGEDVTDAAIKRQDSKIFQFRQN